MKAEVLFQDKDVLVAVKPAGIPSQADKTGDIDLTTLLSEQSGTSLHVINRLDRPVSGIMLFGKNEKTAGDLTKQIQNKTVQKGYWAVLRGKPEENTALLTDYLIKNGRDNQSSVVKKGTKNAKEARLSYEVKEVLETEEFGVLSLISIQLDTGRHHQIRVQFAARQTPVFGDMKYGSYSYPKGAGIALSSVYLSFKHPISGEEQEFTYFPKDGIFEIFNRG